MGVVFEHRLRIAGYETRALELDGDGPPLLLLHGWADSADTWRPLLDRLRRDGRAAVAVDLPGFGTASALRDGAVLPQLDRFVTAALRHLCDDRPAVVVGNSLGGCAALRAAETGGEAIAGVVPIAPAGLDLARWIGIIQGEPLVRAVLRSPLPVPPPLVRRVVAQVYRRAAFADPRAIDPGVISGFCSHMERRDAAERVLSVGRRLRSELQTALHVERLRCPVLVIWGTRDVMVPASGAQRILAAVPHARLELLEGCGHCPQLERPDRVVELVEEFAADGVRVPA